MSKINLIWVLGAVWLGCTSTTDPPATVTDAATDSGKKTDGGTSTSSSDAGPSGSDSGSADDTGTGPVGCSPVSGGLPCEPNKVYCGASSCDATSQDCCVDTKTGQSACAAKGTCPVGKAGLGCDEAGDCAAGEVCCFTASGITPTGSICQTGPCGLGDFSQSCRGDAECAGSGQCVTGSCAGYKIQTCAAIPATACQ